MLAEPKLRQIGCCNELNAGYAADGYARGKGLGALVITHMVGALSALNAIAGTPTFHHHCDCMENIRRTGSKRCMSTTRSVKC